MSGICELDVETEPAESFTHLEALQDVRLLARHPQVGDANELSVIARQLGAHRRDLTLRGRTSQRYFVMAL